MSIPRSLSIMAATIAIPHFILPSAGTAGHIPPSSMKEDSIESRGDREMILPEKMKGEETRRPELYAGMYGAGNVTFNIGMAAARGLPPSGRPIEEGYTLNPAVGISLAWLPGSDPLPGTALIARILYDNRGSEQQVPMGEDISIDRQGNDAMLPMAYWSVTTYSLITADLLVSHRIGESGLSLLGGPTLGVIVDAERRDAYVPEWASFAGAQFRADRSAMNPIRVGLKGGIQYELPGSSSLRIIPTLIYDIALNHIWEMDRWRVDALQFGFDIRLPVDGRR